MEKAASIVTQAAGQPAGIGYSPASRREGQVLRFHKRYGCPEPTSIGRKQAKLITSEDHLLVSMASALENLTKSMAIAFSQQEAKDYRLLRAKLMTGELSETLAALAYRDEEALADGLADLEYTVVGTAVAYGLPLGDVFDEVHESNMTKSTVESAVANHDGDRGKSGNYVPPNIAAAIAHGRRRQWDYRVGDQLATRDGRRIGNATVTRVSETPNGTRYSLLTDYGNCADKLSATELAELFYAEPIGQRTLRNTELKEDGHVV